MIEKQTDESTNYLDQNKQKNIPTGLSNNKLVSSVFFLVLASLAAYLHNSQRDHPFKPYLDATSYLEESHPKIYAGQVHYPRIPVEYWDHRIKMIKAMGLNTLSVYIFWNYHQISRGVFDFQTGNKNLTLFLELAQKNDMKVLIRPGPYVCAEWDLGGFPGRLLGIKGLVLRSKQPQYLQETRLYFTALAPIIREHLWSTSNPTKCIIMLQIQNQYGFYGADMDYMMEIRKMWHDLNIYTSEYYVDWFINIRKSYWPGASIGLNDAFTQFQIDYIHTSLDPNAMVFGGQIYSGWITFWHKDKLEQRSAKDKIKQYQFLMSHNISYSMYMAHGGTNFGLTAGSNSAYMEQLAYSGQITSYDYDAPINEQGSATQKFHVFRQAISKYADWNVPEIPQPYPMMEIDEFTPTVIANLMENIDWDNPKAKSDTPLYYESDQLAMYHLGIVVYKTTLPPKFSATFMIRIHDLGYIKINNILVKTIDRTLSKHNKVRLSCDSSDPCDLQIITEAMGHINYDLSMQEDQKGLREFYNIDNRNQKFQWKMYTVPIDQSLFQWNKKSQQFKNDVTVQRAVISLNQTADTYLNMKDFYKGFVWVNGHNLGRYWRVGPQYRLFCPGVWLQEGDNQIIILDMLYDQAHNIQGFTTLE